MAHTVFRDLYRFSIFGLLSLAVAQFAFAPNAHSQSAGAFDTNPYQPVHSQAAPATSITAPYQGPKPVVMFQAMPLSTPPLATQPVPQARDIVPAQSQYVAPAWDPANMQPVNAPPLVSAQPLSAHSHRSAGVRVVRGPIRAIAEDTGTAITRRLPEALAQALPWVDRSRKDEPFEAVLSRVADDLSRSVATDPAWALGAQREIRSLARRLDTFSQPLTSHKSLQGQGAEMVAEPNDNRPFRPRPIWPGASGRPETQVRPTSLITTSNEQEGPAAGGVSGIFIAADVDAGVDASPSSKTRPFLSSQNRRNARRTPN